MVEEILSKLIVWLIMSLVTVIVGYLLFRNDQKNKNEAIDTRFKSVTNDVDNKFKSLTKDVFKNDERLRNEVNEQFSRDSKHLDIIQKDIKALEHNQSNTSQDVLETKLILSHFEKTMKDVSNKMDIVLNSLTKLGVNK